MSKPKLAYSIKELCQEAEIGKTTVYKAIAEGKLKARKCFGRTILLFEDVEKFLSALPLAKKD